MLEKILIPVDGSPLAESILRQIARLLRRRESHFVFVRAIEPAPAYPGVETASIIEKDRAEAKAYFRELMGRLPIENARVSAVVREGYPADLILHAAKAEKATMIAMSTHGRTGLARWAWGSVADKVLRGSDVPVLLTRSYRSEGSGWIPAPPEEAPFRRILVSTDGTEAASAVLPFATTIAREFGAEVAALHVVPDHPELVIGHAAPPFTPPSPEFARKVAEEFVVRLTDEGLKTRAFGAAGDPAARILETAAAYGADLIAMSTHGRSGLARLGLGSVTERVLRATDVPMLVVRASGIAAAPPRGFSRADASS